MQPYNLKLLIFRAFVSGWIAKRRGMWWWTASRSGCMIRSSEKLFRKNTLTSEVIFGNTLFFIEATTLIFFTKLIEWYNFRILFQWNRNSNVTSEAGNSYTEISKNTVRLWTKMENIGLKNRRSVLINNDIRKIAGMVDTWRKIYLENHLKLFSWI